MCVCVQCLRQKYVQISPACVHVKLQDRDDGCATARLFIGDHMRKILVRIGSVRGKCLFWERNVSKLCVLTGGTVLFKGGKQKLH